MSGVAVMSSRKEGNEIERPGEHREPAIRGAGPFAFRAIPIQLDPISIGIPKIQRFTDSMVGGAIESDAGGPQAFEGIGQFRAARIKDGQMVKPGGSGRR